MVNTPVFKSKPFETEILSATLVMLTSDNNSIKMKGSLLFFSLLFVALTSRSQNTPFTLSLWENGAPGFEDRKNEPEEAQDYWVKNIHNPSITVYQAANPNGSAVLDFS